MVLGGIPSLLAWSLPLLSNLAGPVQHFKAAILDAWRNKVSVDLCGRKGFRGGPLLDVHGSLQLFDSSHAREFVVGMFRVSFVVRLMGMVTCSGNVPFLLLLRFVKNPEFHDLMGLDKGHWTRCLLWHGWLPKLSGVNGASPWAASAADSAGYLVESALGGYSSGLCAEWGPPVDFDAVEAASLLPDHPHVWTDGSLVLDRVTGVSSSGAGFFAHQLVSCWGHVDQGSPGW